MTKEQESLWPEDLIAATPRMPLHILQEQASALGKRTDDVVRGVISSHPGNDMFMIKFALRSPALDNYEHELFNIWHSIELYPVLTRDEYGDVTEAKNEEEFIDFLKSKFRAQRTRNIVRSIVAQARIRCPVSKPGTSE